jgi:preprotein translocase subunit Sss1
MFRRIVWEEFMHDAQVVALYLLAIGIVLLLGRLLTTPKAETERLAQLPLNDE